MRIDDPPNYGPWVMLDELHSALEIVEQRLSVFATAARLAQALRALMDTGNAASGFPYGESVAAFNRAMIVADCILAEWGALIAEDAKHDEQRR